MVEVLAKSPAFVLSSYIIEELELMTDPVDGDDWPLFSSHLPDGINSCGCMYDTTGIRDGRIMSTGEMVEHHGIQLTIRAAEYEAGRAKAEEIALALDATYNGSISIESGVDFELQNVKRMSSVVALGLEIDSKRNYLFTVDFLVTLRQV